MTTDQKIDEVLRVVQEKGDHLLRLIQDQGDRLSRRIEEEAKKSEARDQILLKAVTKQAERIDGLRIEMAGVKTKMVTMKEELNARIDKVQESVSADINVFGGDLYETKQRVTRLEKKLLS